jgi:HK97 family phage major capsid protein
MTAFPALDELEGKIKHRQDTLGTIFAEAQEGGGGIDLSRVKCISGDSAAKVHEIQKLNGELDDLVKQAEGLRKVKAASEGIRTAGSANTDDPGQPLGDGGNASAGSEPDGTKAGSGRRTEAKSFGQRFIESQAYKGRIPGGQGATDQVDIELKTLMTTTGGLVPETTRSGRVVDLITRPIQVIDLIPQGATTQNSITYMEETTFTNAAAEVAEGGTYPEAALALTERTSPVRKIAVFLPVTDEQLEDAPQVRSYIDNRLPFMIRQRLDGQVLTGTGVSPNLTGLMNTTGIQTQARGTDPVPDAIYKAIVKVRVTGRSQVNGVIMHPTDWQNVRLLRTTDGLYIWGQPSDAGPDRIWGQQVAISDILTAGTAVVGDFANYSELSVRRGVDVQVSNSHSTYFIEGKQAMRADMRAAFVVYRPQAFCTVTGL